MLTRLAQSIYYLGNYAVQRCRRPQANQARYQTPSEPSGDQLDAKHQVVTTSAFTTTKVVVHSTQIIEKLTKDAREKQQLADAIVEGSMRFSATFRDLIIIPEMIGALLFLGSGPSYFAAGILTLIISVAVELAWFAASDGNPITINAIAWKNCGDCCRHQVAPEPVLASAQNLMNEAGASNDGSSISNFSLLFSKQYEKSLATINGMTSDNALAQSVIRFFCPEKEKEPVFPLPQELVGIIVEYAISQPPTLQSKPKTR